MTTLTREQYETICAEKNMMAMPCGKKTSDGAFQNEINSTVWERWSYYAAGGTQEERDIHRARQQGYFEEKRAQAETVKPETNKPVEPIKTPIVEFKKCACGHTIEKTLVMSTSTGSSCPDCYDRMSE